MPVAGERDRSVFPGGGRCPKAGPASVEYWDMTIIARHPKRGRQRWLQPKTGTKPRSRDAEPRGS